MVGNMVLQEYYKHCIDTRNAQCRKPTVIKHITEYIKCDEANNKKKDSVLPYIETLQVFCFVVLRSETDRNDILNL